MLPRMPGIYVLATLRTAGLTTCCLIVFLAIDGNRAFLRLRAISDRQGAVVSQVRNKIRDRVNCHRSSIRYQYNYFSNMLRSHHQSRVSKYGHIIRMKPDTYDTHLPPTRVTSRSEGLRRYVSVARRHSPPSSVFPASFSSSDDITSKVQAVKSRRNLENRRSRVSPPSMVMVVVVSHCGQVCICTPYRESCPLLSSLDARKEGPILEYFLINVRCYRLASHLTLHPPARGGIDPRDHSVLSLSDSSARPPFFVTAADPVSRSEFLPIFSRVQGSQLRFTR